MRYVKEIFDGNGDFDHYEDLAGQELADAEAGLLMLEGRGYEGETLHVLYTPEKKVAREADEAAHIASAPARRAAEVRAKRDNLLRTSDHTQLDDTPNNKVAWKNYRALLRDLPNHANFPNLLPGDWPTEP